MTARPPFLFVTGEDESSHASLKLERRQAIDEGRVFDRVEEEYASLLASLREDPVEHQSDARAFFETVQDLPLREGYRYREPSDLGGIREERPDGPRRIGVADDDHLDRVLGGWYGTCAGCLLGKPVEGWDAERLWGYLRDTGQHPLEGYVSIDVPPNVLERYEVDADGPFVENVDRMPRDDDVDYVIAGLEIVSEHRLEFETEDVADVWLRELPAFATYTAERVAYRNLLDLVSPPETATRWNPYREAVGATIRADIYGYVSSGRPERAAALAWRDARLSHVKNGIYGAMWIAATIAAVPAVGTLREAVEIGLTEIPATCRLAEAIRAVLDWHEEGVDYEAAVDRLHARWDDASFYEWVHAIPNAQIVAIGILWGEGDLGRSICRAVECGFDTDSHAARVGSIVGTAVGASGIPDRWIEPLNDAVETAMAGYSRPSITGLAEATVDAYHEIDDAE